MPENPILSLRRKWSIAFGHILNVAVGFGLLFTLIRVIGTLGPAGYRWVMPVGFLIMMLMPIIFLDKKGRKILGFRKSISRRYYLVAALYAVATASLCCALGVMLFGYTNDNWFVTIKNSYLSGFDITGMFKFSLFVTFTVPAIIFSPVGEEIFFRGFLQESLATKFSYRKSMIIDSAFFALIHLCQHGLVRQGSEIWFFPVSGFTWVMLMFITAYGFAWLKQKSYSIYPAIFSHALFNLVMNIYIFYLLP